MILRYTICSLLFLICLKSLKAQNVWFFELNAGLFDHKQDQANQQFFNRKFELNGFKQDNPFSPQFDFIFGRKWTNGWQLGLGIKSLRIETTYIRTINYSQATGIQQLRNQSIYQNNLNFIQLKGGYDYHFSSGYILGSRLSFGFAPSSDMFLLEKQKELYALNDQVKLFESGRNMPKSDLRPSFRAIELVFGKQFQYFSLLLYGRITWTGQKQDLQYPRILAEPPNWSTDVENVRLRYRLYECGLGIQVPLSFF